MVKIDHNTWVILFAVFVCTMYSQCTVQKKTEKWERKMYEAQIESIKLNSNFIVGLGIAYDTNVVQAFDKAKLFADFDLPHSSSVFIKSITSVLKSTGQDSAVVNEVIRTLAELYNIRTNDISYVELDNTRIGDQYCVAFLARIDKRRVSDFFGETQDFFFELNMIEFENRVDQEFVKQFTDKNNDK